MNETFDFEKAWLGKLSAALDETSGKEVRRKIMKGSEDLSADTPSEEIIAWSRTAMDRMDTILDENTSKEIMTRCACHYPREQLQDVRQIFEKTCDVEAVLEVLRDRFTSFLRDVLGVGDEMIGDILDRGWGLAGILEGSTVIATKIPKSGFLLEYMSEKDPVRKRQLYCHCPRIRDVIESGETISPTYCYCGAGFYKDIWECILSRPVDVEIRKSLLNGDDVCSFAIHLHLDG